MAAKVVTNDEPLMTAARTGQQARLRQLLEAGEDPNMCVETGWNPLHTAAWNRQPTCVKLLIEYGAHLEPIFKSRTPFQKTAERGFTDIAGILLDGGADIEASGSGAGWTTLIIAAWHGNARFIQWLIDRGADVHAVSPEGYNALHGAAYSGRAEVVKLLLKYNVDIECVYQNDQTPLHIAIDRGQIGSTRALIEGGADIEATSKTLWTPLYRATKKGHEPIVKLLLDRGARVDARVINGWTPLHAATMGGHSNLVRLLLQNGAPKEARLQENSFTPLHEAANRGLVEIVEILLDFGTNIEARSKDESTPLHLAATKGHVNVVELLLKRHANRHAKDKAGKTPGTLANDNNHTDVSLLLEPPNQTSVSDSLASASLKDSSGSTDGILLSAKGVQGAQEWLTRIDRINALVGSVAGLNPNAPPVKIAVLDTGCSRKSAYFTQYPDQLKRIKGDHWRDFAGSEKRAVDVDSNEHGTMVTTLLLRMARNAEIYVARIAQTAQELGGAVDNVAAAIRHAQDPEGWNVDLICMSFGFNNRVPAIELAIVGAGQATARSPAVFLAAAANNGANSRELFPAYLHPVISVRGTDSYGTFVGAYSPPPVSMNEGLPMYGTLGENVPYAAGETSSGCSVATPIMAGMIALIMQWMAYKGADADAQRKLRSTAGVRELFKRTGVPRGDNRYYVHIWNLFANDGKECVTRVEAAMLDVP
ncbi:hypothetical protein TWF696_000446 [Orbilia brochopaga]|uniref:Peptidase S8/S53 domain-containing protein n=1 Tax=Orbilia brochopaga TaxID=3140254 RepID=A0AAV9VDN5_9PEZI